eukprot:scaffold16110_cov148-Isochrysis_galbana.AAC.9
MRGKGVGPKGGREELVPSAYGRSGDGSPPCSSSSRARQSAEASVPRGGAEGGSDEVVDVVVARERFDHSLTNSSRTLPPLSRNLRRGVLHAGSTHVIFGTHSPLERRFLVHMKRALPMALLTEVGLWLASPSSYGVPGAQTAVTPSLILMWPLESLVALLTISFNAGPLNSGSMPVLSSETSKCVSRLASSELEVAAVQLREVAAVQLREVAAVQLREVAAVQLRLAGGEGLSWSESVSSSYQAGVTGVDVAGSLALALGIGWAWVWVWVWVWGLAGGSDSGSGAEAISAGVLISCRGGCLSIGFD